MKRPSRSLLLVAALGLLGCDDDEPGPTDVASDLGTDLIEDATEDTVDDPDTDPVTDPIVDLVADPDTDPGTDAVADADAEDDADAQEACSYPESVYCIDDEMVAPTIGVRSADVLTVDGLAFKDSNDNGALDDYEDWRLSPRERAEDLVAQMSPEQLMGLLLEAGLRMDASLDDGSVSANEHTDIVDNHIRQALLRWPNNSPGWDAELLATHFNNLQELAEAQPLGIPNVWTMDPIFAAANNMPSANLTGDPGDTRLQHQNMASIIPDWPLMLGLGAIDDEVYVEEIARMHCEQIRAVGIRWMLGPQAELASEPMWSRVYDTFGDDEARAPLLAAAYIRGFQGASDHVDVFTGCVATTKHYPGGGANEGGMDSHSSAGRFNVYPGDNFAGHLDYQRTVIEESNPFALMPVYSILEGVAWNEQALEPVGASYEPILMIDILRDDFGWDGFVTSDWGAQANMAWGLEELTRGEKLDRYFEVGGHQVGNGSLNDIRTAYDDGDITLEQIEAGASRALEMAFVVGAFENPYVDPSAAQATIDQYVPDAREAMRRAFTLLKNDADILPLDASTADRNSTTGIQVYYDGHGWCTGEPLACSGGLNAGAECATDDDCSPVLEDSYLSNLSGFTRVSDPADADYAIIRLSARFGSYFGWDGGVPLSWGGYANVCSGGDNEGDHCAIADDCPASSCDEALIASPVLVYDQTLNYPTCGSCAPDCSPGECLDGDETASTAGGGFGGSAIDNNIAALRIAQKLHDLIAVRATNPNLRIIAVVSMYRPFIVEPWIDDIDVLAAEFGMTDAALLDLVFQMTDGTADPTRQPTGTLPMELPSSDEAVYNSFEDVPHDTLDPTYETRAGITFY